MTKLIRPCLVCGKPVIGRHGNSKLCSDACKDEHARAWYRARHARHKERHIELARQRYLANPEKYRAAGRARYAKNPDKYRALGRKSAKRRRQRDPEAIRERQRAWRLLNLERERARARKVAAKRRAEKGDQMREAARQWRENNPEKMAAYNEKQKQRYAKNPEHYRARARDYHEKNYERVLERQRSRYVEIAFVREIAKENGLLELARELKHSGAENEAGKTV